jgi:hypothetical protein
MSADLVLKTIHLMSRFHLDMGDLRDILQHILEEERVITQSEPALQADDTAEVFGDEAQIALMRRILALLQPWDEQHSPEPAVITALDRDLETEEGPMFFEMVKILWGNFYKHWDEHIQSHVSSDEMGSDSDEMSGSSEDGHEHVRRTGVRRLSRFRHRQTDMGALLQRLQNLYA